MSQEKVDRYKEYKKNRKENLAKEKKEAQRRSLIWKIVLGVLALALLVALGITAYNAISKRIQARPDYDRTSIVIGDVAGLYETTTAEETTEEPTTQAEETTDPAGTTTAADVETTAEPAGTETTTAAP